MTTMAPRQLVLAVLWTVLVLAAAVVVVLLATPTTSLTPSLDSVVFDHGLVHELQVAMTHLLHWAKDVAAVVLLPVLVLVPVLFKGRPAVAATRAAAADLTELLSLTISCTGPPTCA